jgi:hypothetical protein
MTFCGLVECCVPFRTDGRGRRPKRGSLVKWHSFQSRTPHCCVTRKAALWLRNHAWGRYSRSNRRESRFGLWRQRVRTRFCAFPGHLHQRASFQSWRRRVERCDALAKGAVVPLQLDELPRCDYWLRWSVGGSFFSHRLGGKGRQVGAARNGSIAACDGRCNFDQLAEIKSSGHRSGNLVDS